jgi:phage FluMu gp28-like protein
MVEENTKESDRLIANMKRTMEHPWSAIEDGYIYTLDGIDLRSPIKQFPTTEYLKYATDLWMKEKLTAWPKSRRMIMSWTATWWHLWLAMFHEGASVYFQSETEKKSDELIERAEFMRSHIPQSELILPKLKGNKKTYCSMVWPGLYSQILGVAQGANQLRGPTATALLFDECAFWERQRESITAAKPTIEGGGRITLISSANPGFFKDIVFDTSG